MSSVIINTSKLQQLLYTGDIGPTPFHEPGTRSIKFILAEVINLMIWSQGSKTVAIDTSLLATAASLGEGVISDYDEGEESGDELIWLIGPKRSLLRKSRVLRTMSSVPRLTRTSFSAVGAALTKEALTRAATATAKRREVNI